MTVRWRLLSPRAHSLSRKRSSKTTKSFAEIKASGGLRQLGISLGLGAGRGHRLLSSSPAWGLTSTPPVVPPLVPPPCATRSNRTRVIARRPAAFRRLCWTLPAGPDVRIHGSGPHCYGGVSDQDHGARGGLTPSPSASRARLTPPAGQSAGRQVIPAPPAPRNRSGGGHHGLLRPDDLRNCETQVGTNGSQQ